MPFVLILVDISFHTLLHEPLQKGWREVSFSGRGKAMCTLVLNKVLICFHAET